jgi:hypothetical protein
MNQILSGTDLACVPWGGVGLSDRDIWSGCRDLNPGPLAPQASALARLRHSPKND